MSEITSKKVSRWYYNHKGYATENAAYRAWAHQLLLDEIFGKKPILSDFAYDGSRYEYEGKRPRLAKFEDASQEQMKEFIDDCFAEKFPHGDTLDPRCEGICQIRYRPDPSYDNLDDTFEEYAYPSCKAAQKRWYKAKIEELKKEDFDKLPY